MKRIGKVLFVVIAVIVGLAVRSVMAEEPPINPSLVVTPRVVAYGTNPFKIGTTEVTEANLVALQAQTNPATRITRTFTNIVWNAGATTGRLTFVNGVLSAVN